MRFIPKTEAELMAEKVLPKGDYIFEISNGTDEVVTKEGENKGKAYIKLILKIFLENGKERFIEDVIFDELKLLRLCACIEKSELYKRGEVHAEELIGGSGNLYLGIREDKTGQYPPKNVVFSYKKAPEISKTLQDSINLSKEKMHELNDEIPF